MTALRVLLILVAFLLPAGYGIVTLESLRSNYSPIAEECKTAVTLSPVKEAPVVIATIQKQSEILLNWSLALLGGVITFLATPSLRSFRFAFFIHLTLAPALGLLGGSVYASLLLLRRMTFLQLNNCLVPTSSINSLLDHQTFLLSSAVVALTAFAVWCLIELSAGWLNSAQTPN